MIDSRDFLAAKRRAENEVLLPAGPKVAFTGGLDFNDHRAIWDRLDKALAKHPDMVLLHGGSPRGAERIAACWADNRKVAADRLQARLDASRQGGAVQAQRPNARRRCRSASSSSRAPASPPISPTRRASSAFRCGNSPTAARKRRQLHRWWRDVMRDVNAYSIRISTSCLTVALI